MAKELIETPPEQIIYLKKLANDYLKARKKFLLASQGLPDLAGNDNIVGRIGELVAVQYLRSKGRNITKNTNATQKGYDLKCGETASMISVKVITAENKSGRTTAIKKPWNELVLIELDKSYRVSAIGYLTDRGFDRALSEGFIQNAQPTTSRSMLREQGLFATYGELDNGDAVKRLL